VYLTKGVIKEGEGGAEVISGHQVVIKRPSGCASEVHQRSSKVIKGHQRSSEVIRGHQETIRECIRECIRGCPIWMDMRHVPPLAV